MSEEKKKEEKGFSRHIGLLFFLFIFIGWNAYGLYSEYYWHQLITEKKQSEGWVVAGGEQIIDCASPWQWFWSVPNRLFFVKPKEFKNNNGIVIAEVLDSSYSTGQKGDISFRAFNCEQQKYSSKFNEISELNNVEWFEAKNKGKAELLKFVCSNISK